MSSRLPVWSLTPLTLKRVTPVPSDIEIVKKQTPKKISVLASEIGLKEDDYDPYGKFIAKVTLPAREPQGCGRYVVVCGINPTPLGEGKSTTTIGLAQCLGAHLNKNTIACIRQPSMGPTFGIKGGAAGGGYSQVIPMEDFNLHFTGDIHAISAATNLIAAAIDARHFHESTQPDESLFRRLLLKGKFTQSQVNRLLKLGIKKTDASTLTADEKKSFARLDFDLKNLNWTRVVDVNDRFLRKITIGQSPSEKGFDRETQYDISVASELMAILTLAKDLNDGRDRIGQIVVGYSTTNQPITCEDLCITGAVTALLRDAFKPNLIQTLEGTPVLVHGGPFANIAHGNSSVIADRVALELVGPDGYVLTESGFGSDIGLEKFLSIKVPASGLMPDAVVIVCTVRALKMHGGGDKVMAGSPLPKQYVEENVPLVEKGMENLLHHIKVIREVHGLPVVVAINRFQTDTESELKLIHSMSLKGGASGAAISSHWEEGGNGAIDLSKELIRVIESSGPAIHRPIYEAKDSIKEKIKAIVTKVYGGSGNIQYSPLAEEKIDYFTRTGFSHLPICVAKTQSSLTADAKVVGAPANYPTFPVIDVRLSAGAGFLVPLAGTIQTMPGLPTRPAFFDIDIDMKTGEVNGLF